MKRKKSRLNKKRRHIIFILLFIIAAVFFFVEEFEKDKLPKGLFDIFKSREKPEITLPESRPSGKLPRIALVMDDLGTSRKVAGEVLSIKSPLTLSILPQQDYSAWIAEEGKRLGHDIIIHVPMESARSLRLGKGGVYTWMTDKEIARTLEEDISSVPHIIGANNHMGSAFTRDERAMNTFISELKKRRLFFLDSLTTPKTVGVKLAKSQGIKTLSRDVFLDNTNDPVEIEKQWEKLIIIARKRGHAIALSHPRENTIEFLKKVLKNNKAVTIVPISELVH